RSVHSLQHNKEVFFHWSPWHLDLLPIQQVLSPRLRCHPLLQSAEEFLKRNTEFQIPARKQIFVQLDNFEWNSFKHSVQKEGTGVQQQEKEEPRATSEARKKQKTYHHHEEN